METIKANVWLIVVCSLILIPPTVLYLINKINVLTYIIILLSLMCVLIVLWLFIMVSGIKNDFGRWKKLRKN